TEDLARGMTLATAGTFRSTSRIDARLSLLKAAKPLKDVARVHFHAFTVETVAEARLYGTKLLKPGEESFAQLKLAGPVLLLPGDRFIIRQFSPVITIGGGIVLDASPAPRKRTSGDATAFLKVMLDGSPAEVVAARVARRGTIGLRLDDVPGEMNMRREDARKLADQARLQWCNQVLLAPPAFAKAATEVLAAVKKFHDVNPLVAGMSKEELRERVNLGPEVFDGVLDQLAAEKKLESTGDLARLPGRGIVMKDDEAESKKIIEHAFQSAGLKVPLLKDVLAGVKIDISRAQKIMTLLLRDKVLIKISDDLVFHNSALADLRQKIIALKGSTPKMNVTKIDVAQFKELLGVTRKYAIPLLEYLDRERVTRRVGDERIIL
ncbi:MAG: SelB C-terminal domain-containing protein, partial [Terriglobales bacterium]